MFSSFAYGSGLFSPFDYGDPFATGMGQGYGGPPVLGIREDAVKRMGVDKATALAKRLATSSKKPVLVPIPNTGAAKVVRPANQVAMAKLGVVPKGKAPVTMPPQLRGVDFEEAHLGHSMADAAQAQAVARRATGSASAAPRPAPSRQGAGVGWGEEARKVAERLGLHHDAVEMATEFVSRGIAAGARFVADAVRAEQRGQTQKAKILWARAEALGRAVEDGQRMATHHDLPEYVGLFLSVGDNSGLNALSSALYKARTGNVAAAKRAWPWIEKRAQAIATKRKSGKSGVKGLLAGLFGLFGPPDFPTKAVRKNKLTRQIAMQNAWLSTQPTIASRGSGGAGVAGLHNTSFYT